MRRAILILLGTSGASVMGCQAVIGLHDYTVSETGGTGGTGGTTASTGGTGTGGATTGGTAGTGGTGGDTGGTGGSVPVVCTAAGAAFDLFPSSSDQPNSDRVFLLSVPGALPPRVHAVHTYDSGAGHMSVRTMKSIGMLTSEVSWDIPPGKWRFQQGRVDQSHVSVQGYTTGGSGPEVGEVQFSLDNEQQVQPTPAPAWTALPAPIDCPGLATASVQQVTFASEGANTHFAVTLDDCLSDVRRLYYYAPAVGLTKLREGTKDDGSLALWGHARNGTRDMLLFFDGTSAAVSGGTQIGELQVVTPVALGDPSKDQTVPLGVAQVGAADFAFWWMVPKKGPALPANLYGGVIDGTTVGKVAENASYATLQTYDTFEATSTWSRPSVGAIQIAVAEIAGNFGEVRLSVLGQDGKALLLDQSVEKGSAGQYLDASAAYYGQDTLIISWTSHTGAVRSYRAQAFTCK